jgi:DNA gyrase subunit B
LKKSKRKKMVEEKKKSSYGAAEIKVLEGLEGVRKRPAMYIGSTGKDGLHHMVYEVVDNSVDEAMAGYASEIKVFINKDGSVTIDDDGRGIPVEMHEQYKVPALQVALTKLHAGGKFDKKSYEISGGLHGVGISVVNALSEKLIIEVKRGGKIYQQEYSRGLPKNKLKVIGKTSNGDTGTKVTFFPDPEIFSVLEFNAKILETRFREVAFLNSNLKIKLKDERSGKEESFHAVGGLIEFVKWLNKSKEALHKPLYLKRNIEDINIEVSLQYTKGYQENIFGFVNTINTVEGGTHISGFKSALTRVINDYVKGKNSFKDSISGNDVREGLTAIVSIKIPNPQFEGQTKTKLGNSEVEGMVKSAVITALSEFLEENPKVAKLITSKAVDSAKARLAAKKARDLVRRKNAFSMSGLPGKLSDCSSKKSERTEFYLVEGESAGGCFSGNTSIALADGRNISFKNLVEEYNNGKINYCYTLDEGGSIAIGEIKNPRITKRNVNVIKVILDNEEEIVCTPDHKFMLRDGSFKEARDLSKKDSIMPFHRGNEEMMFETVKNYNHKIKKIIRLKKRIDVYDLEVPETHNFALSSGIFVHNSAKQARNKEFQAILPLRGKILNVEKSSKARSLSSEEVANIITAIGTGIGDQFDLNRLRYNKIIIMTDADVDGEHIKTLLLTFFYRFMPELIEKGHVYVAMPPLYRIRKKKDYYVYSDRELDKMRKKLGDVHFTRFKGLGEMSSTQLWETTMNPKTRKIKRVFIEDAVVADQTFIMLMGADVLARKEFIQENAKEAMLDI